MTAYVCFFLPVTNNSFNKYPERNYLDICKKITDILLNMITLALSFPVFPLVCSFIFSIVFYRKAKK